MAKQPSRPEHTRRASRIWAVPIKKMRVPPALVTQRRFRKSHGDEIAAELDLNKLGFPIINHRDDIMWILDGQHRIYALRQNGFENEVLDCEVYKDLTDAEMADIFLGRDDRRAVSPFDKFHVSCTANHQRECDIRRAVETQGLKISQTKADDCVGAVGALGKIYDRNGDVVLGQTLRTVKAAYAGDPAAFEGNVLQGIALVFGRYNGRTHEKDLAARLAAAEHGVRGLLRRAESLRERTGNQKIQCVAASVVEIYNKGSKNRLPSWWRPTDKKE